MIDQSSLTIGQFGQLSQLSRKALRLYDERGLLEPAHIDPFTGYRYYRHAQMETARRIRLLRMMEMPLEQIGAVLAAWEHDPTEANRLIQLHVSAVQNQLTAVQLAARLLNQELSRDKEQLMSFEYTQTDVPAQYVAAVRKNITAPSYHKWANETMRRLVQFVKDGGATPSGDPIVLYYGPLNEEDDGPVEICIPFTGATMPEGDVKVRQLPAHRAVRIRTYGEYNQYPKVLEMWNGIGKHVHESGVESNFDADMTTYEIWHEDFTTTISWPIR